MATVLSSSAVFVESASDGDFGFRVTVVLGGGEKKHLCLVAVASYQNAVSVEWRPFLIDAGTKVEGEDYAAYNARRWGGDG